MAPLYALSAVNDSGHLKVSSIHNIYWEECGNKSGVPILYLHGGPGGGIDVGDRFGSGFSNTMRINQLIISL
jgi:proline iminopeptidase